MIVVGATDKSGKRVIPESSRGPAPNGRKPDCVAPGGSADDLIVSLTLNGKIGREEYGTSFAAAQVTGVLALLLQKDRDQTPDAMRTALVGLCQKLPRVDENAQGKGLVVLK